MALLVSFLMINSAQATSPTVGESAYQRIQRTNTIRCGYTSWDPLFFVDAKTGEKKGIFHDLMEEVGKRLDYKIIWQEEIGWGSLTEAIKTNRVDMVCAGYWLNPARIKNAQSSLPQLYSPLYIYVRADENRIKRPDDLNSDKFTVSSIDGSAENQVITQRFSHAKHTTLPELGTSSDTLQNLVTKKADFLIMDSATATTYMAANPGKIKNAFPDTPMILFPNVMLMPAEDTALKNMIDNILLNIEYDGTLDAILKKYHANGLFLRNSQPR
jgi:ABC-type amino acid transport substrate-binding protein